MSKYKIMAPPRDPVTADQIRPGDPYEVSDGWRIEVMPTGRRGGRGNLVGGAVVDSDPAVSSAGVDTGFSPRPDLLRAPDVSVGNVSDEPGWGSEAPSLAIEYADAGQDKADLQKKIVELLEAGTRWVWVVRLKGRRRVEVYEAAVGASVAAREMGDGGADGEVAQAAREEPCSSEPSGPRRMARAARVAWPGEVLTAPGVLRNPVPVEALYDRDAAHAVTLRNLLQRKGYESLEAVEQKGLERGLAKGREEAMREARREALREVVRAFCEVFGIPVTAAREAALAAMDVEALEGVRAALKRDRRWPEAAPPTWMRTRGGASRPPLIRAARPLPQRRGRGRRGAGR